MKRSFYFIGSFLFAAGLILSSCEKSSAPETPAFVLSASQDGDEVAKTMLAEVNDKYEVHWKTGDKVSINGTLSNAVASKDNGKRSVDFTFSSAPTGTIYKVLYPGNTSSDVITLPATQNYVEGSFDGAAAASYGTATKTGNKYSATLTPFCGILRFALKGTDTITKIVLTSQGEQCLTGSFDMTVSAGGFTGGFNAQDGASKTLTYYIGSLTLNSSTATYFYVAIPAQEYPNGSGIIAKIYNSAGEYMQLKFWGNGYNLENRALIQFVEKDFAAGRTENLFQINNLTSESGSASLETRIVVGCYNLYTQSSRTKDYMALSISGVREALGQAVADMGADIIGINEIDNNFKNGGTYSIKSLAESKGLTGYTWELAHPDDIDRDGNWLTGYTYSTGYKFADGFAYRTSMFSITDHNYVWISHTADNTYYDDREDAYDNSGSPETTCAYAKFTHKSSGKQFYVFVTHTSTTDHIGSEVEATKVDGKYSKEDPLIVARRARIVNNVKYLCSQKAGSLPFIVMGDFNFGPYYDTKKTKVDVAYTSFTGSGYTNAYDDVYSAGTMSGFYTTYPGTQTGSPWGAGFLTNLIYPQFRIDHIWLKDGSSQNITAETYRTVRRTYDHTTSEPVLDDEGNPTGEYEDVTRTWCPSDHFPVVATILFE